MGISQYDPRRTGPADLECRSKGRHLEDPVAAPDLGRPSFPRQRRVYARPSVIRRFLLHVLLGGFHRIRHYGSLAGSARKAKAYATVTMKRTSGNLESVGATKLTRILRFFGGEESATPGAHPACSIRVASTE